MMDFDPTSILVGESGQLARYDAFNRLYTAQPFTLIDYQGKYGLDANVLDTSTATGGTVTAATGSSSIRVAVTGTSGSLSRLLTKEFYRYQTGRGQEITISMYMDDTGQTNQRRRWGTGTPDATNPEGLGWELDGTTLNVVRYPNVSGLSNEIIPRSGWLDALDGTGPSGLTLDLTKGNIYQISYQWLGVGVVEYRINDILIYRMVNPGLYVGPYMRSAVHPVTFEVQNTGTSTTSGMNVICINVTSQGGEETPGYSYAIDNGAGLSVGGTLTPIIAIRPKTTFNSVTNRIDVIPRILELSHSASVLRWQALSHGTLSVTGGSWVSAGTNSSVEYNISATGYTGGELVTGGTLPSTDRLRLNMEEEKHFGRLTRQLKQPLYAVNQQFVIIGAKDIGGTTTAQTALTWGEIK